MSKFPECSRCQIRRVPLREGGGPRHDLRPTVLHRVRQRPQHRSPLQPPHQLHSGLLSSRRQLTRTMATACHSSIQKGSFMALVTQFIFTTNIQIFWYKDFSSRNCYMSMIQWIQLNLCKTTTLETQIMWVLLTDGCCSEVVISSGLTVSYYS